MTPEEKKAVEPAETPSVTSQKKSYVTPTIVVHGTVADLTRKGGNILGRLGVS